MSAQPNRRGRNGSESDMTFVDGLVLGALIVLAKPSRLRRTRTLNELPRCRCGALARSTLLGRLVCTSCGNDVPLPAPQAARLGMNGKDRGKGKNQMAAEMKQSATESFANLCAAFVEAEAEDRRCEEKLQRARDDAERAQDRVNTMRKQLQDLKWLEGLTIRTALVGSSVVTLLRDGATAKAVVTAAETRDGNGRR